MHYAYLNPICTSARSTRALIGSAFIGNERKKTSRVSVSFADARCPPRRLRG